MKYLRQAGILHPKESVLNRIESRFALRLLACGSVNAAFYLYQDAGAFGTSTITQLSLATHVSIGSPLSEALPTKIRNAVNNKGQPCVVKILTKKESSEAKVCEELDFEKLAHQYAFVSIRVIRAELIKGESLVEFI